MTENKWTPELSPGTPYPTDYIPEAPPEEPWNGQDPGGTPAPEEARGQAFPYDPPQKPQRVRRVGSFTMGVALIASGVVALSFLLFQNTALLFAAAKWSPALLILLGIEVLLSNILFSRDRLKYDFLSGFFCLCLICGSLLVSTVPFAYGFGVARHAAEETISRQISDLCYEQLRGTSDIASVNVQVRIDSMGIQEEVPQSYDKLRAYDSVYVNVRLLDGDETGLAFAQRCKSLSDRLKAMDLTSTSLCFSSGDVSKGQTEYDLTIDDRFQMELPAEKLAGLVRATPPLEEENVQEGSDSSL